MRPSLPSTLIWLAAASLRLSYSTAFVGVPVQKRQLTAALYHRSNVSLYAKKKKTSTQAKGFGKVEVQPPAPSTPTPQQQESGGAKQSLEKTPFLQSVDNAGSTPAGEVVADPEDRAKALLRDKFGLKTLEEQLLDAKQLKLKKEDAKKWADMKKKAELNQPLDIFSMLPAPVLIGIDRFLKGGTALCSLIFILAGVAITVEAWSKTSNSPLPENIDNFIATVVEPNFTPGLLVLLSFSVSLGAFAALQLGSQGATYKED